MARPQSPAKFEPRLIDFIITGMAYFASAAYAAASAYFAGPVAPDPVAEPVASVAEPVAPVAEPVAEPVADVPAGWSTFASRGVDAAPIREELLRKAREHLGEPMIEYLVPGVERYGARYYNDVWREYLVQGRSQEEAVVAFLDHMNQHRPSRTGVDAYEHLKDTRLGRENSWRNCLTNAERVSDRAGRAAHVRDVCFVLELSWHTRVKAARA